MVPAGLGRGFCQAAAPGQVPGRPGAGSPSRTPREWRPDPAYASATGQAALGVSSAAVSAVAPSIPAAAESRRAAAREARGRNRQWKRVRA
jgi:hypothetical protein